MYFGPEVFGDISGASPEFGDVLASPANRLGAGSPDSEAAASVAARLPSPPASRDVGEICSAFFSLNLASSPSTRFNSASSTSVLGPRFLGTASTSPKPWLVRYGTILNGYTTTMCRPFDNSTVHRRLNEAQHKVTGGVSAHRICKGTEKPGMPRRQVEVDYT